jgi:hypothetical protein
MAKKACESKKSESKYVAFGPEGCTKPVASGSNVGKVIDRARKKGVEVPTVVFFPKEVTTYIY